MQLKYVDCVTKRKSGITLLLLLTCSCIVYNASEWKFINEWMEMSRIPLHDNKTLLILWYNKEPWINGIVTFVSCYADYRHAV